jgi:hypothetical protein
VTDKLKRTLALALAGGALAIGVPAALAAGGGSDNATNGQPSGPAFIQDEGQGRQGQQERPDRGPGGPGDCPEKDGGGHGGSGESGSGSTAPDTGSATEL